MNPRLVDSLFCLLCVLALLANAAIFRSRAAAYAEGDPVILAEATGILRALVVYVGGLFLLLTAGVAFGLTGPLISSSSCEAEAPTTFEIAYVTLNAAVLARGSWWIYRQGGAERLAEHHQMFRYFPSSKAGVMVFWTVMIGALGWAMYEKAIGLASCR